MVRLGTGVQHLIDECGGLKERGRYDQRRPDDGTAVFDTDLPVDKDTTTLLFLEKKENRKKLPVSAAPAVWIIVRWLCSRLSSTTALPAKPLGPRQGIARGSCISCGVCTYVCPPISTF